MKKESKFLWGWKNYEPQADPAMTRERAAKLIRVWRSRKDFALQRIGKGHYTITARGYETEPATIIIL